MFTDLVSIKSVWHYKLTRVYSAKDLPEPVNALLYNYTIDQVCILCAGSGHVTTVLEF